MRRPGAQGPADGHRHRRAEPSRGGGHAGAPASGADEIQARSRGGRSPHRHCRRRRRQSVQFHGQPVDGGLPEDHGRTRRRPAQQHRCRSPRQDRLRAPDQFLRRHRHEGCAAIPDDAGDHAHEGLCGRARQPRDAALLRGEDCALGAPRRSVFQRLDRKGRYGRDRHQGAVERGRHLAGGRCAGLPGGAFGLWQRRDRVRGVRRCRSSGHPRPAGRPDAGPAARGKAARESVAEDDQGGALEAARPPHRAAPRRDRDPGRAPDGRLEDAPGASAVQAMQGHAGSPGTGRGDHGRGQEDALRRRRSRSHRRVPEGRALRDRRLSQRAQPRPAAADAGPRAASAAVACRRAECRSNAEPTRAAAHVVGPDASSRRVICAGARTGCLRRRLSWLFPIERNFSPMRAFPGGIGRKRTLCCWGTLCRSTAVNAYSWRKTKA